MNCFSQKLFKNLPGKLFIGSLSIKKNISHGNIEL